MKRTIMILALAVGMAAPVAVAQAQTASQDWHMTGRDDAYSTANPGNYPYGMYGYRGGLDAYGSADDGYRHRGPVYHQPYNDGGYIGSDSEYGD